MRSGACRAPDVVADDADAIGFECVEKSEDIVGVISRAEWPLRLVAVSKAAQVRGDQSEAILKPRHDRFPGQPEFRPAVKKKKWRALPRLNNVK